MSTQALETQGVWPGLTGPHSRFRDPWPVVLGGSLSLAFCICEKEIPGLQGRWTRRGTQSLQHGRCPAFLSSQAPQAGPGLAPQRGPEGGELQRPEPGLPSPQEPGSSQLSSPTDREDAGESGYPGEALRPHRHRTRTPGGLPALPLPGVCPGQCFSHCTSQTKVPDAFQSCCQGLPPDQCSLKRGTATPGCTGPRPCADRHFYFHRYVFIFLCIRKKHDRYITGVISRLCGFGTSMVIHLQM